MNSRYIPILLLINDNLAADVYGHLGSARVLKSHYSAIFVNSLRVSPVPLCSLDS